MKYLTKYKLFESSSFSNLIEDVRDMTLELSDSGFDINIKEVNYTPPMFTDSIKALDVQISTEFFTYNDIKETVERIEEYCFRKDAGYGIDVEISGGDWMELDRFIYVYGDEEFGSSGISLLIYSEDDYGRLLDEKDLNESIKQKYSIYDFYNDIHYNSDNKLDQSEIKHWVDHFIGDGWFDIINRHLSKAWEAMKKVDIDYVNDRLYEIWDDIPTDKDKWVTTSIIYGDYEKIDEPNKRKYNGTMPVSNLTDEKRYLMIMNEIIRDILAPTFKLGSWKDEIYIRQDESEEYVTDKKYQCVNFNIMDYEVVNSDVLSKHKYAIQKLQKYSPINILDMYVPCVLIDIGGHRDTHTSGTMNLKKLESDLDEVLPSILPTLEYDDVIFDMSREDRRFDDNRDIYDYTVKILLKF